MPFLKVSQDENHEYPGFRLKSQGSSEREFVNKNDEKIIEVLGKYYDSVENNEPCLRQDIVAVLKENDAEFYNILQWHDPWRSHPGVGMINSLKLIIVGVILLIINSLLGLLIFSFSHWIFMILAVIAVSFIELIICPRILYNIRKIHGILKVLLWIKKQPDKEHYQELLKKLSNAHSPDKSKAASIMLKIV